MTASSVQQDHPNFDRRYAFCGIAASKFMGDPRINEKQMAAIVKATEHDHQALVMGIDANSLPVVRARVGQPSSPTSWAIKRNGDPTAPGDIYEVWGAPQTPVV